MIDDDSSPRSGRGKISLEMFRVALCRALNPLDEDSEPEEFVARIPGLRSPAYVRPTISVGRVVHVAPLGRTTFQWWSSQGVGGYCETS
jgi:hypothetical protein